MGLAVLLNHFECLKTRGESRRVSYVKRKEQKENNTRERGTLSHDALFRGHTWHWQYYNPK
jgi:hypothetical protein